MRTGSRTTSHPRSRLRLTGAILAMSLVATACASGSGGSGGSAGGESLPADASKADFVAAMADMDPITLTTQSASTPGKSSSIAIEKFKKAVEEWSGGKITIEITYSNGLVPLDQALEGIADGLMDFGYVAPLYDPARYPASSALITASSAAQPSPVVGTLQTTAMMSETTYATEDIPNEMAENGVKLLIPAFPSDSAALACTSERASLGQLEGAQTRTASDVHAQQVEALRMSPTSLAYSELFEGLQRGTVDCVVSLLLAADIVGFLPEAPHLTIDSQVGFATNTNPIAISKNRWEELPLAAQQLLFDKGKVFQESLLEVLLGANKSALETAATAGGGVHEFDAAARDALRAKNETLMRQVAGSEGLEDGQAFAKAAEDSARKWQKIITEDLGYENVPYGDFAEWYAPGKVDLEPYLDRMWNDVMLPQRPS